jgi:AraC-like DNA-binding protein
MAVPAPLSEWATTQESRQSEDAGVVFPIDEGVPISLIDIALDCGFSSHAHFPNTFRQIVGVTPSEYRRIHGPILKKRFLFASSSFGRSLFSE